MKVYVVLEQVDYEGETLMGIFQTRDKAEEFRIVLRTKTTLDFFHYVVEEWEVE